METSLQLTLTELNENLREIYIEVYSVPDTAEYIYLNTTAELKQIFGANFPDYSDKDGINEIKKADTVTATLPGDMKSPRTGNASDLALWISLLLVSGGAAVGITLVGRKKKRIKF